MSEKDTEKIEDKFNIRLVLGKLEYDGNSIESFMLLDYFEIVGFEDLELKLKEFYEKGIEKIKRIKEMY